MVEGPDDDTTSNVVIGDVLGPLVQAGHIHGDLHVHEAPGLLVDEQRVITVA